MKLEAIKKLILQGMTEIEATREFQDKVNYYLRGTTKTPQDIKYAIECAANDVLFDDVEQYNDDMMELLYN